MSFCFLKPKQEKSKRAGKKSGEQLKMEIQELNEKVNAEQQVHLDVLKDTFFMQRGRYCSVAGHFANVCLNDWSISFSFQIVKTIGEVGNLSTILASSYQDKLADLGAATRRVLILEVFFSHFVQIPTDKQELLSKKERTFIDVLFPYFNS